MKDAPYSFHCTPCGFSHAGECAPKDIKINVSVDIDPESAKKVMAAMSKALTGASAYPLVGSVWNIEDLAGGVFSPRARTCNYHVTVNMVSRGMVEVQSSASGHFFQLEVECWNIKTGGKTPAGNPVRMVPAQPAVSPQAQNTQGPSPP